MGIPYGYMEPLGQEVSGAADGWTSRHQSVERNSANEPYVVVGHTLGPKEIVHSRPRSRYPRDSSELDVWGFAVVELCWSMLVVALISGLERLLNLFHGALAESYWGVSASVA